MKAFIKVLGPLVATLGSVAPAAHAAVDRGLPSGRERAHAHALSAPALAQLHTKMLKTGITKRTVPDDPDPWDEYWARRPATDRINPAVRTVPRVLRSFERNR